MARPIEESPAARGSREATDRYLRETGQRIVYGEATTQPKRPAPLKPATRKEKQMRTLTETDREIARLDQEREAEQERLRQQRMDWNLDSLPQNLRHDQKLMLRTHELAMAHARQLMAEGKLKSHQVQRMAGGLFDEALDAMDTETYARMTGRVRNQNGVWVESGEGDQLTPAYRQAHIDDVPGDLHETRRQQREIGKRVARDLGGFINHSGHMSDKEFGAWMRQHGVLPDSLIDAKSGEPIADDEALGAEVAIERWDRDQANTVGYTAGDSIREHEAARRAKEEANDPALKAQREMQVDEKWATQWRQRDEHRRLSGTREGREKLERAANEAVADSERRQEERREELAGLEGRVGQVQTRINEQLGNSELGHILNDALTKAHNPEGN